MEIAYGCTSVWDLPFDNFTAQLGTTSISPPISIGKMNYTSSITTLNHVVCVESDSPPFDDDDGRADFTHQKRHQSFPVWFGRSYD